MYVNLIQVYMLQGFQAHKIASLLIKSHKGVFSSTLQSAQKCKNLIMNNKTKYIKYWIDIPNND